MLRVATRCELELQVPELSELCSWTNTYYIDWMYSEEASEVLSALKTSGLLKCEQKEQILKGETASYIDIC